MATGEPVAAMCVQVVDAQGVLQFTLVHAVCCALHRHTIRVIHPIPTSFAAITRKLANLWQNMPEIGSMASSRPFTRVPLGRIRMLTSMYMLGIVW